MMMVLMMVMAIVIVLFIAKIMAKMNSIEKDDIGHTAFSFSSTSFPRFNGSKRQA